MSDDRTYKIFRCFHPSQNMATQYFPNDPEKSGLTLQEAQEHCSSEDSQEPGKWFEGFLEE